MPLNIKDPRIAEMAEQLRALTNAASKTEAVSKALETRKRNANAWRRESRGRSPSPGRLAAVMVSSIRRPSATRCGALVVVDASAIITRKPEARRFCSWATTSPIPTFRAPLWTRGRFAERSSPL